MRAAHDRGRAACLVRLWRVRGLFLVRRTRYLAIAQSLVSRPGPASEQAVSEADPTVLASGSFSGACEGSLPA